MTLITSSKNSLIKHLIKLQKDSSYRKETNTFLIEGEKLIKEWLKIGVCKHIYLQEGLENFADRSRIFLKKDLCQKISSLKTNDGIFAEVEKPFFSSLENCQKLLILEKIQDPKNLGALSRSALAFGFEGILLTEGSVDPFSPKVIRASMGAIFKLPIYQMPLDEWLKKSPSQTLYIADMSGCEISHTNIKKPLALLLGGEAQGSSLKNTTLFEKIAIPIKDIESLNVAIAGSLLMYEIGKAI